METPEFKGFLSAHPLERPFANGPPAAGKREPGRGDPLRQKSAENCHNLRFSREIGPLPPFLLAGGGGWQDEIMLDVRAFLAFRRFPLLAESGAPNSLNIARSAANRR